MTISADIVSLQPTAAPIVVPAAAQPLVSAVGQRATSNNDRRQQSSSFGDKARGSVAFRSFLNASTLAGLNQTLGAEAPTTNFSSELRKVLRQSKVPTQDEGTTLSAEESESLYNSAKAAKDGKSAKASSGAPEYLAATRRYAKSFFAVSGTFAKPGEALELTA